MKSPKDKKLQSLLIHQILENGSVELLLPDGIRLEIGITQEDQLGKPKKSDDYCYVVASRKGKSAILDSYNLGLQFESETDTIVYEEEYLNDSGINVRRLDVV